MSCTRLATGCTCDNCQRGEDQVEIHHKCEECLADEALAASRVGVVEVPPSLDKVWDLLLEVQSDPAEVAHILECHLDQLPEYFMRAMATIELSKDLIGAAYPCKEPG